MTAEALDVPWSAAQWDVMQIEALYRIARQRALTNSETEELYQISQRVALRLEVEAAYRVPEFALRGQLAAVW